MSAYKQKLKDNLLHILIAVDKFKGSLTSLEAAHAIRKGIENKYNIGDFYFDIVEIADGGDGSAQILKKWHNEEGLFLYNEVKCMAANPIGRQIETSYLMCGNHAFIEMAGISGLELLNKKDRNPLYTTTYGLGELIKHAIGFGALRITLSIGGSATNDGGTGMLQALGFEFLDAAGNNVTNDYMCGSELEHIFKIVPPLHHWSNIGVNKKDVSLKVICDVTNPLLGVNGATMVYGAQKGADAIMRQRLEAGMCNYANAAALTEIDKILDIQGAGAAGGVGFAALQFLGAELISGWKFFAELTKLEQRIAAADIIISGEGKIDYQSMQGKVVDGVIQLAKKYDKPVVLFCGINETCGDNKKLSGVKIYGITNIEPDIERCMVNAKNLLTSLAQTAVLPVNSLLKQ